MLVLRVLALLVLCSVGAFACESDVYALMTAASLPNASATCVGRTWTITGNLSMPSDYTWDIKNDYVIVTGSYIGIPNSVIHFWLDAVNASNSGYLDILGQTHMLGTVTFDLKNWDMTPETLTLRVPFSHYGSRTTSGLWTPQNPLLGPYYSKCWVVSGGTMPIGNFTVTMAPVLTKKVGVTCENGGYPDRTWIIAMIVLLFLWGALLGLIAWITCKCCKDKFWTNE